jgi:flagellar biosynthesis chaperone FliJ
MKKFEFRLDSVLRWRDTQLQLERGKLNALLSEEANLRDSLETLASERRSALQCLAKEQLFSFDLRSLSSYLVGAEARATMLQEQIRKRSQSVAEQRDRVIHAERNVKLLLKLREKRQLEWKTGVEREIEANAEESWLAANFRL